MSESRFAGEGSARHNSWPTEDPMNRRSLLAISLLSTIPALARAQAQDNRFVFLGDYRGMERVRGGVVARAENGAVRIENVAGVGLRIRYSFSGAFDTSQSWATIPDSIVLADAQVSETPEALTVRGGAHMGWITGVLSCVLLTVLFAIFMAASRPTPLVHKPRGAPRPRARAGL